MANPIPRDTQSAAAMEAPYFANLRAGALLVLGFFVLAFKPNGKN